MKQAITLATLLAVALPAVADDRCDKEPTYYNINPGSLYSSSIIIFADNQRLGTNFNMYIHTADIGRPKIPEKMFGVLPAAEKPGLELLYMVSETGVFPHDRSYLMSLDGTLSEPVYLEGHKLPHSLCQRKIIGPDNNPVGSTNFVVVYTAEKQPQLKSVCEGNTTYLKIDPNTSLTDLFYKIFNHDPEANYLNTGPLGYPLETWEEENTMRLYCPKGLDKVYQEIEKLNRARK